MKDESICIYIYIERVNIYIYIIYRYIYIYIYNWQQGPFQVSFLQKVSKYIKHIILIKTFQVKCWITFFYCLVRVYI